ncbi:hypothetical protein KCP74_10515 [Salmonella enterica subsp. enterica]|nr:hypothetical protein KCP74_10515 [Salmonella enterica subsp. enterica]
MKSEGVGVDAGGSKKRECETVGDYGENARKTAAFAGICPKANTRFSYFTLCVQVVILLTDVNETKITLPVEGGDLSGK